jgi:hypothetical protein
MDREWGGGELGPVGGGKTAALDALRALAPKEKATEALLEAYKSAEPQVRRWALRELNR